MSRRTRREAVPYLATTAVVLRFPAGQDSPISPDFHCLAMRYPFPRGHLKRGTWCMPLCLKAVRLRCSREQINESVRDEKSRSRGSLTSVYPTCELLTI